MERRNVTITLDEETARWARVEAARRDTSVSRFVGDLLQQQMHAGRDYEDAMSAYLETEPVPLRRSRSRYPQREELHDRAGLR